MSPRERAVAWAADVAADPATVFLDTETTGLGVEAEICDIAIVGIDGRVLLDSLVLPLNPIPPEASAVHGITIGMLDRAKAPMWRDLVPRVVAVLTGRRVVVYNADYDAKMIDQSTAPQSFPDTYLDWQCAMKAYSDYDGTLSTNARRPGFKWHKLGDAASALGIENPGAHRALADAETNRRLVLAMAALAEPTIEEVRPLMQELLPGMRRSRWD